MHAHMEKQLENQTMCIDSAMKVDVLRMFWVAFRPSRSHAYFQANSYMEPNISICGEYTGIEQ